MTSKADALTPAAAQRLEQDTRKKEAKAEAKAENEAKKRKAAKVRAVCWMSGYGTVTLVVR